MFKELVQQFVLSQQVREADSGHLEEVLHETFLELVEMGAIDPSICAQRLEVPKVDVVQVLRPRVPGEPTL